MQPIFRQATANKITEQIGWKAGFGLQFILHGKKNIGCAMRRMFIRMNMAANDIQSAGRFTDVLAAANERQIAVGGFDDGADAQGAHRAGFAELCNQLAGVRIAEQQIAIASA